MINIKKGPNLKVILFTITVLFLFASTGYPSSISKNTLRVPLEKEYSRMEEIMQDGEPQESQTSVKSLTGPFLIPGTNTRFNVTEITDHGEMKKILKKWFRSKTKRDFKQSTWESDVESFLQGSMIILKTEKGKILGLSFFYKEKQFMFSKDEKSEDIGPIYKLPHMEISGEIRKGNKKELYRRKRLGRIIIAKQIEKTLNDPDIKDKNRLLLAEPATKESDKFFDELEAVIIHIYRQELTPNITLSEDDKWKSQHRIFYRGPSEQLLENVRKRIIQPQLTLPGLLDSSTWTNI